MAYVIFGDLFTFPDGNATTNQVYAFSKGFIKNGINVFVICFGNEYLNNYDGIIENIKYNHPFGQAKRNRYFIARRWFKIIKYPRAFLAFKKINKQEKIEAIILLSDELLTQLFSFFIARILKIHLIKEVSEHPLREYNSSIIKRVYGNLKLKIETRFYDGIFCISNYLIDFFKNLGLSQNKLLLVPSTVDPERFVGHFSSPLPYKYILYCGSLTILKDGVDILMQSFGKISHKYPDINLVLIGSFYSTEDEKIIKNLITTLHLDKRIMLLGQLSRTDILCYLANATILALARPHSMVADAGFPSKLTEYLATGRPVVATEVGDIPLFIKNNFDAFLARANCVDDFADKLAFVLDNYEFAEMVGLQGRKLTTGVFNFNVQSRHMIGFVNALGS